VADASEGSRGRDPDEDRIRVWLVERTYSDDEQNVVILVYATRDGRRYLRKERALTSFTGPERVTHAAMSVPREATAPVDDPDRAEWYATEADRMATTHEPDDAI